MAFIPIKKLWADRKTHLFMVTAECKSIRNCADRKTCLVLTPAECKCIHNRSFSHLAMSERRFSEVPYITREVLCMVMAVRGAVQVESNNPGSIMESVVRLIEEIAKLNDIGEDDIVSIVFSQTKDVTALNPATALRETGFAHVPLFCTQEPEYSGSMPRVIRVLVTVQTEAKREPVPVYLGGAENLRSDLFKKE